MKKTIITFILCCLVCFFSISDISFASNTTISSEDLKGEKDDYVEITELENEIIEWISAFSQAEDGKKLPDDFSIDFENAKKIYVDADIFSLETSKKDSIIDEIQNNGIYMWLLLVNVGDDTYQVHISKGLPLDETIVPILSDDEIRKIKEDEGKWTIAGLEKIENTIIDYDQIVTNELNSISYDLENVEVMIVGGLEHINQPVALVMNNEEVDLLIPLYDLEIEGTKKEIEEIKPEMADINDEVYLYDEIKEAVNNMESMEDTDTGNGSYIVLSTDSVHPSYLQTVIFISSICILSLIIYRIKKNHKHNSIESSL